MQDLCEWDRQFINSLDQETLFAMVMATNYLDAKLLMDVSCVKLASMIRGKTAEQIRETFVRYFVVLYLHCSSHPTVYPFHQGLPKDLTEEEKEQLRQEDKWCVENGVDHNGEPVQ